MQLAGIVEDGGSSLGLLPTFNLIVRRSHLIEDVLSQLSQFENEDLRMELMVRYRSQQFGAEIRKILSNVTTSLHRREIISLCHGGGLSQSSPNSPETCEFQVIGIGTSSEHAG